MKKLAFCSDLPLEEKATHCSLWIPFGSNSASIFCLWIRKMIMWLKNYSELFFSDSNFLSGKKINDQVIEKIFETKKCNPILKCRVVVFDSFGQLTSNPCKRPMSIISLAWFGTIVITWKAQLRAAVSSARPALWEYLRMASRSMWYLVRRWIGLIRRSVSRSLNPNFKRISWNIGTSNKFSINHKY